MISVCIITKNECDNLNICLERLAKYPVELVVVDTGSTDNTKEIASKYTSNIYDFSWCNDFSAARNFAVSKAKEEYILMIDTDEFVDSFDYDKVTTLVKANPDSVGQIHRKNLFDNNGSPMNSNELISRLFPKSIYSYTGSIHEQLVNISEPDMRYSTYPLPIFSTHVGYQGSPEKRRKKGERNLTLLLKEYDKNPSDTYILYQIGKAFFYLHDYNNAIVYFEKAMELPMNNRLGYVSNIMSTYAYCLINLKQYSKALILEAVFDDFSYSSDFLFVMGLIYMYNARFQDAIDCFYGATKIDKCDVEGVNSFLAFYNIGVIFECLGDKQRALGFYKQCGSYPPAGEGITRCSS